MRPTLMASLAAVGLIVATSAFSQTAPDTGTPPAPGTTQPPSDSAPAGNPNTGMAAPAPKKHHRMLPTNTATGGPWAHEPGTGESGPASTKASNITATDSRSAIAPHFPQPSVGQNAGPEGYLRAAERALATHQTGEAQQALEMAETRLLDRSTPVSQSGQAIQDPMVTNVSRARQALGNGDTTAARAAIRAALGEPG